VIIGTLLSIAVRVTSVPCDARETVLRQDLAILREAIDKYYADLGQYPDTLAALANRRYVPLPCRRSLYQGRRSWTLVHRTIRIIRHQDVTAAPPKRDLGIGIDRARRYVNACSPAPRACRGTGRDRRRLVDGLAQDRQILAQHRLRACARYGVTRHGDRQSVPMIIITTSSSMSVKPRCSAVRQLPVMVMHPVQPSPLSRE